MIPKTKSNSPQEAGFNDLIRAIQQAFIGANAMAENQHLQKISTYFDEDGFARTVKLNVPYFDSNGNVAYKELSVPEISLVPISSLKLDEVSVEFNVRLYGKVNLKTDEDNADGNMVMGARKSDAERHSYKNSTFLGYFPHGGIFHNKKDKNFAHIKLKFTTDNPPEGLMKICDQFVKVMI